MENEKILLEDLLNGCVDDLPEFVNHKNLIYCCENDLNKKVYIGETKQTLKKRWKEHKRHLNNNKDKKHSVIYDAIRKYGTMNFHVFILEENLEENSKRKEREKYWISVYNSFIGSENSHGYNMTIGGYIETKFAKKSINERGKTCMEKYGCLPIHTKESRIKGLETNRKNHNGKLAFQNEKYREKAKRTQIERYGMLAFHLPENKEKAKEAQKLTKEKNGGVLPFNTPDSIKKAQELAPLYRMIGCINRHICVLQEKKIDVTPENYVFETDDTKHMWQQHIPHVLTKIDKLRKLDKWTPLIDSIFSKIIYDDAEKGIKKIKFKK